MNESLKNMLSSVDWSKMMSGSDARNAIIGSALGGTLLGGASLFRDKDPEEDKGVPVRDALLGAVLGGAAGYGIPKALSLYRDSGSLAPNNDMIGKHPALDVLGATAKGGVLGAVAVLPGAGYHYIDSWRKEMDAADAVRKLELVRAKRSLLDKWRAYKANRDPVTAANLANEARIASAHGLGGKHITSNLRAAVMGDLKTVGASLDYRKTMKDLKGVANSAGVSPTQRQAAKNLIKNLKRLRSRDSMGFLGIPGLFTRHKGITYRLSREAAKAKYPTGIKGLLTGLGAKANYKSLKTLGRAAGKYGLIGAGLAGLGRYLLGPSANDNYAN